MPDSFGLYFVILQNCHDILCTVLGVDIRDNVYGGGNNAEVTGNANVNIGKKTTTP